MDFFDRTFSLYGSVLANLFLLAGMSSTLSGQWCEELGCRGGIYPGGDSSTAKPPTYLPQAWHPYVENPGYMPAEQSGPDCPQPRASDSGVFVIHASLPPSFDPEAYPGRKLYACVKLTQDGRVAAARLIAGTGMAPVDRALLRGMTGGGWSFAVPAGAAPAWQRVRLDAGSPTAQIIPYFRLE